MIIFCACGSGDSTPTEQVAVDTPTNESPGTLVMDERYANVRTIIAVADCDGPLGSYTTEVHSTTDNYTYFFQTYSYKPSTFHAVLPDAHNAIRFDPKISLFDTLPNFVPGVIRSQEFHKLTMFPNTYLSDLSYVKDRRFMGQDCEQYSGFDKSKNQGHIYYNKNNKLVVGVELLSPIDSTQRIDIFNEEWTDSNYGKLVKKVEIVQAGKDTFTFNFQSVEINSPDFKRYSPGVKK